MKRAVSTNPFQLIALKQRVGREEADRIAMPLLVYLDAAHRAQGFITAENALVRLVAIGQVIGSKSGNRAFYDVACTAGRALFSACGRGQELLALTTGEYRDVKKLVVSYLRILPTLELAMLVFGCTRADQLIEEIKSYDQQLAN